MKTQHALVGKIAGLPFHVREELNRRLHDGQTAPIILPWLNALQEVREILAGQFDSKPVNPQNLCHWRATGFKRWLEDQKAIAGNDSDQDEAPLDTKSPEFQDMLRLVAEFYLRVLRDKTIRQIAEAPFTEAEKFELIGHYLYGDEWIPCPVSEVETPAPGSNN